MITTLPAVQHSCKDACRYACIKPSTKRADKRTANRRHRRTLNRITRRFILDPERFDDECFNAPTLSSWDLY